MKRRLRVRPRCCSILRLFAVLLSVLSAEFSWAGAAERSEWPFAAPKRPAIPDVRSPLAPPARGGDGEGWLRNPIDAFVLARLQKAGLQPNPPADKIVLLRRVTFDLTGLLPTLAERDAFLADRAPDAYERLVDRLLRSPRFGERWAQHWLDLVRFAETDGFKLDKLRPNSWRYRDYVIRACNDDLPYDRFLNQQIAGDQLEPNNPDALIATGFFRLPPEEVNGSNYRMIRQDILDDNTDVFSSAFLGLTLGCARCHDHKFDPLTQKDYFRLQAFFTPLMQRDDLPLASAEEQANYRCRLAKWQEATKEWRAKCDALLAQPRKAIRQEVIDTFDADTQRALATPASRRTPLQRQLAALASKQIDRKVSRAQRRLSKQERAIHDDLQKKIEAGRPEPLPAAMGVVDMDGEPPPTHRLATGNYRRPRERVEADFPECLDIPSGGRKPPEIPSGGLRPPLGKHTRADLARWLCRPDHPLTSRVLVNRLWQHYFGTGIVATPNDFGAMGDKPTHPELLDYLADELIRNDWKVKATHRAIVTSATYRQASSPKRNLTAEKANAVDSGNKLLWHARVKRREAESIRDAVLQASGQLNPRMGGPSNCPLLPAVVLEGKYAWEPDERPCDRNRRSIYVLTKRNFTYPLFAAFDQPDRVNTCPVRPATITAPQALAMLNGEFSLTQARHLAGLLLAEPAHDPARLIHSAYLRVFSREPDDGEVAEAEKFLRRQSRLIGAPSLLNRDVLPEPNPTGLDAAFASAVVDFCHALLNSAEFLDVE
ncbi:MAG: DUF1549 and DUF1553 domain-containing protein [Gemmataceae bacterium]